MLKNYLRVAMRTLRRQKVYAVVNVLGLTVGLACVLLLGLFIVHELSFDRFHEKADRVFRIVEEYKEGGQVVEKSASIPFPFGPTLTESYGVTTTRLYHTYQKDPLVSRGADRFYEPNFFFTDSTFFDVFSFSLVRGDPATVLDEPASVVLTESAARKYFGAEDPIGRTLLFENTLELRVTGVAADPPANAHFRFDFLAALQHVDDIMAAEGNGSDWRGWFWNPCHTYVLLPEGTDPVAFEAQLPSFVQTHFPEWLHESVSYDLQALPDIHLHSNLYQEIRPNGSMRTVQLFALIGALILLIAAINFTNVATARSLQRAKEVGVRRVLGAERGQLIGQFLGESLLMTGIAVLLAVVLTIVLLPAFADLVGAELDRSLWQRPWFFAAAVGLAALVGVLAGLYPALIASSYRPSSALRGKGASGRGGAAAWLRRGLVVTQFAVSILLLVSTFVVYRQLDHLRTSDTGFRKEHVVMVPIRGTEVASSLEAFKAELVRDPHVVEAAAVSDVIGRDVTVYNFGLAERDDVPAAGLYADGDFVSVFGLELADGTSFDPKREAERDDCLVNEALVRQLQWREPLGQRVKFWRGSELVTGAVAGVTKDFNFQPVRQRIRPLVVCYGPSAFTHVAVRVEPGAPDATMAALERVWTRFAPARPFQPFFLDADLNGLYRSEARLGKAFTVFAVIAMVIACLGLFGLAAHQVQRRTKEIGVRKALGASVPSLLLLLTKDFLVLVGVAFVLAAPFAYVGLDRWLRDFASRVDMGVIPFVAAGVIAAGVAWVTVSYHVVRAATSDPVQAIRYE